MVHLGPVAHGALVGTSPGVGVEPEPGTAQGARVGTEPSGWGGAAAVGVSHGAGAVTHGARKLSCGRGRLVGAPLVFPLTEMV